MHEYMRMHQEIHASQLECIHVVAYLRPETLVASVLGRLELISERIIGFGRWPEARLLHDVVLDEAIMFMEDEVLKREMPVCLVEEDANSDAPG